MIIDNLKNKNQYLSINKGLRTGFDFIEKCCKENLPVGRYDLDGTDVFAVVQEYDSKNPVDFKFEGHTKYIDIQYISSGIEEIEVVNIKKATGGEGYIEEREVEFYTGGENTANFILEKGEYGIFYPDDIHKPGLMHKGKSTPVRKVLVKVKLI